MLAVALAAALFVYGVAIGAPPRAAKVKLPAELDRFEKIAAYGSSKVLLAGSEGELARVDNSGSLDSSFGQGGIVQVRAADVAVDRRGRILVAGGPSTDPVDSYAPRVTRLLPDGSLDPTFGDGGVARVDFGGRYDGVSAIAVAPDGRVFAGGTKQTLADNRGLSDAAPALARLHPNGAIDRSFGRKGIRLLKGGWEGGVFNIYPTRDGGLVAQGEGYIGISIWRLTESGAAAPRFGDKGVVELESRGTGEREEELIWLREVGVFPNGKIVAAAIGQEVDGERKYRMTVVRLNADGRVDRSFGRHGWAFASFKRDSFASGIATLPRDVTVVGTEVRVRGGARHIGLVAFGPDGSPSLRFSGRGKLTVGLSRGDELKGIARQGKRILMLDQDRDHGLWLVGVPGLR